MSGCSYTQQVPESALTPDVCSLGGDLGSGIRPGLLSRCSCLLTPRHLCTCCPETQPSPRPSACS